MPRPEMDPYEARLEFEARLRAAVLTVPAGETDEICAQAAGVATAFPWADTRTVANALVDALGTGWGALYLHWTYEQGVRR